MLCGDISWLLHSVCWEPRFLELFGLLMCVGIRIGGECRLTPRVVLDRGLARDIPCLLEGVTRLGGVARTSLTLGEIGLLFIIWLGGVGVGMGFLHWERSCHHFVVILVWLSWRGRRTPSPLQTDLLYHLGLWGSV